MIHMLRDLKDLVRRLNSRGDAHWTTRDELAFIVGLGTHGNGQSYQPLIEQGHIPNRRTLLQNYLQASINRTVWGEIDRSICIEMAATLLASGQNEDA
jgi:hypothetical protein